MPRKRKTTNSPRDRLAGLKVLPHLVLEGGAHPLELSLAGGDGGPPQAVLWVDAATGDVRASGVVEPAEDGSVPHEDAIGYLVTACAGPFIESDAEVLAFMDEMAARAGRAVAPRPIAEMPKPGLPARIRMERGALAEAARALMEPLGVHVETVEGSDELPQYEHARAALAEYLRNTMGDGPGEPFNWEIAQEVVAPLMKAAGRLWRRAPWSYLPDHPPVAVDLGAHGPEPGATLLYASILGGGGMVEGVALYSSARDYHQAHAHGTEMEAVDEQVDQMIALLRQSGAPMDGVPPDMLRGVVGELLAQAGLTSAETLMPQQNSVALLFGPADDEDPAYLAWLRARGLKYPSREGVPSFLRTQAGQTPRPPTEPEAHAATLALEALNQFFSKFGAVLRGPLLPGEPLALRTRVAAGDGVTAPVEVTYPPRDWDYGAAVEELNAGAAAREELEAPDEPGSLEGARTVYRFLARLEHEREVWRRIEVRGDQTLHDLHNAMQEAFDWDDDHLYAFFLSGIAWDESTEYVAPLGEGRHATRYRLEHLPLRERQRILYIFDFGDEWRHTITVEAIARGGVASGATYPRITEQRGRSVEQYPAVDEGGQSDDEG